MKLRHRLFNRLPYFIRAMFRISPTGKLSLASWRMWKIKVKAKYVTHPAWVEPMRREWGVWDYEDTRS